MPPLHTYCGLIESPAKDLIDLLTISLLLLVLSSLTLPSSAISTANEASLASHESHLYTLRAVNAHRMDRIAWQLSLEVMELSVLVISKSLKLSEMRCAVLQALHDPSKVVIPAPDSGRCGRSHISDGCCSLRANADHHDDGDLSYPARCFQTRLHKGWHPR